MTFKLRFKDIDGDAIGSGQGWDVNLEDGTVFLVDPANPDIYSVNAEEWLPGAVLVAMARVADDITIEEV